LLVSLALVSCISAKLVPTPHGMRPEECVLEVPNGAHVAEDNGRVRVTVINDAGQPEVSFYNSPSICSADMERRPEMPRRSVQSPSFQPINGWLDYAGWYPGKPDNNIQYMGSTYTVPNTPASNNQQTLYYFIGIQDNSSPAVNILQPVLTFGPLQTGWYAESWACCPANISTHSSALTGLKSGTSMTGFVERLNADLWEINSAYNGKNTTLFSEIGGYNYNWFAATEEVYGVTQCNQFAGGPMAMAKMVLKDKQGNNLTPKWVFTKQEACGGTITEVNKSPLAVVIQHSQAE